MIITEWVPSQSWVKDLKPFIIDNHCDVVIGKMNVKFLNVFISLHLISHEQMAIAYSQFETMQLLL